MPARGTSRQSDRDCLVCGETTRIAHLGVEACRACAVFYRRARTGHDFICRSGTGRCPSGKSLNCKRCRYDRIVELLNRSGALEKANGDDSSEDSPCAPVKSHRLILDRAKVQYRAMCFNRLSNELNARSSPPHPLEISLEKGPFFPADFAAVTHAMRALLTAALEFGNSSFLEFAGLPDSEKWTLVTNFFYRFRMLEGLYRTVKFFPTEQKFFVSYATYFTIPFDKDFFKTAPKGADIDGVFKYMQSNGGDQARALKDIRELMNRMNPSEVEIVVVAVLMFWTTGDLDVSDRVMQICERYRDEILKELHTYYREEMGLDDYATRLGELMMLMQFFERTKDLKEHFEMLRLFGVMTDDNFIYRMQKDLTIS